MKGELQQWKQAVNHAKSCVEVVRSRNVEVLQIMDNEIPHQALKKSQVNINVSNSNNSDPTEVKVKTLKTKCKPVVDSISYLTLDDFQNIPKYMKSGVLFKNESGRRNLLTILRHFHRIREVRGPG